MNYEKKIDLIRKLINKTFPNIEKKCKNQINDTYQVIFVIPNGLCCLTILIDSEWHEIKKKLKTKFLMFFFTNPDCQICFNKINFHVTYLL